MVEASRASLAWATPTRRLLLAAPGGRRRTSAQRRAGRGRVVHKRVCRDKRSRSSLGSRIRALTAQPPPRRTGERPHTLRRGRLGSPSRNHQASLRVVGPSWAVASAARCSGRLVLCRRSADASPETQRFPFPRQQFYGRPGANAPVAPPPTNGGRMYGNYPTSTPPPYPYLVRAPRKGRLGSPLRHISGAISAVPSHSADLTRGALTSPTPRSLQTRPPLRAARSRRSERRRLQTMRI